jgi:hypothetical protein
MTKFWAYTSLILLAVSNVAAQTPEFSGTLQNNNSLNETAINDVTIDSTAPWRAFTYEPSVIMAIFAGIGYALLGGLTLQKFILYKTWYFMLVPQAAVASVIGASARLYQALIKTKSSTVSTAQNVAFGVVASLLGMMAIMTFTRFIWWTAPAEKRRARLLLMPVNWVSFIWVTLVWVPDLTRGVAAQLGKPKHKGEKVDANSIYTQIQTGAIAITFASYACWTLWAMIFMYRSRGWLVSHEVAFKKGRSLGWVCIAAGILVTVSLS